MKKEDEKKKEKDNNKGTEKKKEIEKEKNCNKEAAGSGEEEVEVDIGDEKMARLSLPLMRSLSQILRRYPGRSRTARRRTKALVGKSSKIISYPRKRIRRS